MSNFISNFLSNILSLHRYSKRIIAITIDLVLCIISTWLAYALRLEEFILLKDLNLFSILISLILALPIFWWFGLYRTIFRYTSLSIFFTILAATSFYGLIYFFVIGIYSIQEVPRSIGVLQPMILFFGIIISRIGFKFLLITSTFLNNSSIKKNILIYGAGESGRQLAIALENSLEFKVVGFVDDDKDLHRQVLLGKIIYSPKNIKKIIKSKNISLVFLALSIVSRNRRNQIIKHLNKFKLIVKTLPSISEIVDGKITLSDIRDFNVEDLLNREEIKPNIELLHKNISSKIVLVTGAGGSIGSELSKQISRLKPKKLLLLELNEFALYKISEDLKNINKELKIIPLLANVQNSTSLDRIFKTFKIDTIYHAAAYKHVPLVEENICEGVKNNVIGTYLIAQFAIKYEASNFVLISSDKAVRATNIMGASKRLSEICVQSLYDANKDKITKFSIVRFGNVLQSSGSVIPKFTQQIKQGGPVTLTHINVTRYFMTMTEASQLVIQAGAMSEGCEVFVLDMGKSIKIKDLVENMIKLSGLTIKNDQNIDGDIEIKIIGLRPGEKLYEELLLGDNPKKTNHKKIKKAQDPFLPLETLKINLDKLIILLDENKADEVKNYLKKLVQSYQSNSEIVDHIYKEQKNFFDSTN